MPSPEAEIDQSRLAFLAEGGEMGKRIRRFDWAASPLGPPEEWPLALKTAVGMLLSTKFPMFIAWGAELRLLYNDAYAEVLGGKHPAALGHAFEDVWAEIWSEIGPLAARALAGEPTYFDDLPLTLTRKGYSEQTWFTFSYGPLRGDAGKAEGMFCVCTETTEKVLAERAVRESEERFRLIADSAPVPMWVTRLDRKRSFVNRAYVEFLGISYEEAVNFDWRTVIHPDDAARILAESVAGEAALKPFELVGRYRSGNGGWRWIRSISQPRFGPKGEHVGFIGVAHDISALKEGEAALREMNETLEKRVAERTADLSAALDRLQAEVAERLRAEEALRQAQKMEAVGQLTGGIAHDFNNLLTPIMGGLELIAGRLEDARLKRVAETALESARRGAKLTGQLLAFSRIQRISMAPVDVNDLIEKMRTLLRHTIGRAITIETKLDPAAGHGLCDANQLENAILNLAINARDAMPDGGKLTIATGRMPVAEGAADLGAGEFVRIRVADTGAGMPPEVLARATEPFFSTKPLGKGTGLGLAQVYGIAQQSGGTLRIASAPGEGTQVDILLPAAEPPDENAAAGPAAAAGERGASSGARVLVVDDDEEVRTFLIASLEGLGHDVIAAESGEEALKRLREARPDLALIDYAMPHMHGAEVARAVREIAPGLPIVFVTGYAESEQLEAALGGDVPVLRKPFTLADLAAAVEENLPG
jgi:PAS domain S-box-containing protein